jgi:hypothetical protein
MSLGGSAGSLSLVQCEAVIGSYVRPLEMEAVLCYDLLKYSPSFVCHTHVLLPLSWLYNLAMQFIFPDSAAYWCCDIRFLPSGLFLPTCDLVTHRDDDNDEAVAVVGITAAAVRREQLGQKRGRAEAAKMSQFGRRR